MLVHAEDGDSPGQLYPAPVIVHLLLVCSAVARLCCQPFSIFRLYRGACSFARSFKSCRLAMLEEVKQGKKSTKSKD
jgi:hypothetical protein